MDVFGRAAIDDFIKRKIMIVAGVTVYLETKLIKLPLSRRIVFAPFVSIYLLYKEISDSHTIDVIYVPWAPEELESFLNDHPGAVEIS